MRAYRTAVIALSMVPIWLAGCASVPATPDRADVAKALTERAGVDASTLGGAREWTAPPGASIGDGLAMDEAVAIALWNNADFQAALTQLGIARADLIQAGLLRNPILSLLFPLGPKQFEATLSLPIEAIWQRPRRIQDARFAADVVAQQLVAHGLRLVAEVKTAYVDVLAAEEARRLAGEQADLGRQVAEMAASRLRAGDISDFEARLARLDGARLEAARLARVSAHDRGVARLRTLLGLGIDAPALRLTAPAPLPAGCGDLAEVVKAALAARPDVRAAELQIDAAGARAGLERAKILTLTATLDMNGAGKEGFEMGPGLGLELPILSQNQGGRSRAVADLEQASRRYLAVRAAVSAGVEAALISLNEALGTERVLGADGNVLLGSERQQAQRIYDAGEISLLNLLEIRRRLIDTETTRLEASSAVRRAQIRLEEAIGRPCAPR